MNSTSVSPATWRQSAHSKGCRHGHCRRDATRIESRGVRLRLPKNANRVEVSDEETPEINPMHRIPHFDRLTHRSPGRVVLFCAALLASTTALAGAAADASDTRYVSARLPHSS